MFKVTLIKIVTKGKRKKLKRQKKGGERDGKDY